MCERSAPDLSPHSLFRTPLSRFEVPTFPFMRMSAWLLRTILTAISIAISESGSCTTLTPVRSKLF
ncbi:MAG: hypothetical protein BWY89_00960 [Bacteroidetes bacterium ADurb.BinA012]|nr:MAG: hypothetical protein BWY89_00960 [Bacteroidetes bacterium ADurb.BinA012]